MFRLAWVSDPHLNFLPKGGPKQFGKKVRADHPDLDMVVVTGDIAECPNFEPLLEQFANGVNAPVHFVLGNHDAYGGGISEMQIKAAEMDGLSRWLPKTQLVELTPSTALVGHDGWYDARFGFQMRSRVVLSDFTWIREFAGLHGELLRQNIQRFADQAAAEARGLLESAIEKGYKNIFFATHVPPYAQAAWHQGEMSDGHWLPWMSSRVMGEMLNEVSGAHPDVMFTVLCGHTHSEGKFRAAPNLVVLTGHSEYKFPRVCGVFDLT